MDGKHVVIRCPQNTGSEYYNYKHTFSMVLFTIVDADYNFLYVDVGTNGRVNDASVFSKSSINEALEKNLLNIPPEGVFVADDAFPLRTNILKPYARNTFLTDRQKIFNYRLSRARRIVENSFGILVSRFRIFEKPISLHPSTCEQIVKSTCALHNWLRKTSNLKRPYITKDSVDTEDWDTGSINLGTWRNTKHGGLVDVTHASSNNYKKTAAAVRDSYAEKFVTTNIVPWQWKMI